MNRFKTLILLALIITLFNSCEQFRCIEGTGQRVRQSRLIDGFLGVVSEGAFVVYIEIDTSLRTPQVFVEADENIQPYIQIQVRNQNLEIYSTNNRCLNTAEPIVIDIRCNYLDLLSLKGSGLIRAYHLEQNSSYVDLSGSGIIYVWAWDLLDIKISGSGIVYYKGTPRSMNQHVTGSGQIIPLNSK